MAQAKQLPEGVDASAPTAARLYDYYLGGTTNYEVDREAAERLRSQMPELSDAAWANRSFHQRAARWLTAERGIRQFIDIGSGLPTQGNTHEIVQAVAPDARVVYVDIDPMVEVQAASLLVPDTRTTVITADMRDPDSVMKNPGLRAIIDFSRPVGILMTAVLHFVADGSDPGRLVARYMDAVPPGSYLALSHITSDKLPARSVQAMYDLYQHANEQMHLRSKGEVQKFFDGLEIEPPYEGAEPVVTYTGNWGAEALELADSEGSRWCYCAVARRP
jgi:S-adenosyl methyltransferase